MTKEKEQNRADGSNVVAFSLSKANKQEIADFARDYLEPRTLSEFIRDVVMKSIAEFKQGEQTNDEEESTV